MELTDPREATHMLRLSRRQGSALIRAGALESVRKDGLHTIAVGIDGHMTLYVVADEGLFAELCRSMARCAEYADAAAEVAAEAIQ